MASSLCPCCRRSNKLTPQVTTENDNVTGVTISSEDDSDHEPDTYTSWSRLFKKFFHGSPDNRLVFKLFGSRKGVLRERLKPRKDHGSKWMIHPLSRFRFYWDILIVLSLVFTVILLPISIAFYSEDQLMPEWIAINGIVDLLFVSDIIVNFRTGIVKGDKEDEVIFSPKKVALQYMRGWLTLDILSSIPIDYIVLIFTQGQINYPIIRASRTLRIIRLVKLISLLKLLRLSRLLPLFQRWEELFDLAGGFLRILKLVMLMLLMAHWNGCFQFLIPTLQDIPKDSWIAINRLQNATVGEQYTWALFKAISHMLCIGFGRWPPQNVTEAWLTILSMMLGATFYALFIGNMSTLLLSIDSSGRLYNEKLNQVEDYMRYRKLPQSLRAKVAEYYEHKFRKKFFNEESILTELSKGLRESIISHNCQDLIQTVPFFQNASPQFIAAILTKLKFEVFLKGEYIIREGSIGTKMYFIQSGVVAVLNGEKSVETRLSDGSHFGEICLLTHDRRVASIRAETTCDIFSLSKKHFDLIIKEYPDIKCALETVALSRLEKIGKKHPEGTLITIIPPPSVAKGPNSPPPEKEVEPSGWESLKYHFSKLKRLPKAIVTTEEQERESVEPSTESKCILNMARENEGASFTVSQSKLSVDIEPIPLDLSYAESGSDCSSDDSDG